MPPRFPGISGSGAGNALNRKVTLENENNLNKQRLGLNVAQFLVNTGLGSARTARGFASDRQTGRQRDEQLDINREQEKRLGTTVPDSEQAKIDFRALVFARVADNELTPEAGFQMVDDFNTKFDARTAAGGGGTKETAATEATQAASAPGFKEGTRPKVATAAGPAVPTPEEVAAAKLEFPPTPPDLTAEALAELDQSGGGSVSEIDRALAQLDQGGSEGFSLKALDKFLGLGGSQADAGASAVVQAQSLPDLGPAGPQLPPDLGPAGPAIPTGPNAFSPPIPPDGLPIEQSRGSQQFEADAQGALDFLDILGRSGTPGLPGGPVGDVSATGDSILQALQAGGSGGIGSPGAGGAGEGAPIQEFILNALQEGGSGGVGLPGAAGPGQPDITTQRLLEALQAGGSGGIGLPGAGGPGDPGATGAAIESGTAGLEDFLRQLQASGGAGELQIPSLPVEPDFGAAAGEGVINFEDLLRQLQPPGGNPLDLPATPPDSDLPDVNVSTIFDALTPKGAGPLELPETMSDDQLLDLILKVQQIRQSQAPTGIFPQPEASIKGVGF